MATRTIVFVSVLLARKVEPMAKRKTTFHHWYYGRHMNDELNLIWGGWFLWNADEAAAIIEALREFQED